MSALIYCPFPDKVHAREVAGQLLDEKLIVCANILGDVESIFVWEGQRDHSQEVGVLFKTCEKFLDPCVERLEDLHRYKTPAIFGWRCDAAKPSTLAWLETLGA